MSEEIKNLIDNSPDKVVGLKQVLKGIIDDTLWCVIVSSDCDDFIKSMVAREIGAKPIKLESVSTMEELGRLCGIDVKAAVAGLVKN